MKHDRNEPTTKRVLTDDLNDTIRRRAYELYEQRGCVAGRELEDWVQAETEVLDSRGMAQAA